MVLSLRLETLNIPAVTFWSTFDAAGHHSIVFETSENLKLENTKFAVVLQGCPLKTTLQNIIDFRSIRMTEGIQRPSIFRLSTFLQNAS